ncbi:MAG: hypothetical protein GKR93_16170 [Gammaproteobacteria bacterium]|nr:hypothetical protein [Gammaproteobacteria bacterium]
MPAFLPRLCIFAFGAVCLPVCLAYVMGPDNRVPVNDAYHDNAAIRQTGMLRIEGEEFVSGLLSGANCDVVISAGHAAIYWQNLARKGWRKGELRGGGRFQFSLNPERKANWHDLQLVSSGYSKEDNIGKDDHDWSVFRSKEPLMPNCETISIIRFQNRCKSGLIMPGFHFDRPQTRLLDNSCEVKRVSETGIITHNCDSKDGSSGAPLFCQVDGKQALLAINISGLTRKNYYDSGVYGKSGRHYDDKQHKNFALAVDGEFYQALREELRASEKRLAP